MSLLQLKNAQLSFGHPAILNKGELVVHPGERICLVGRNGCGKSTLLKVLEGEQPLDDGQRIISPNVKISRLPQDPPESVESTLFDYVAEGMAETGELLKAYFHQINLVTTDPSEKNLNLLEQLQHKLEHQDAWQFEQQISQVLTLLGLDGNQQLSSLSGGWRRKAALARALVGNPDILLLDEPTNHLDIHMIKWLEGIVKDYKGAVVFVSHDRAFIRAVASRIVDLDRSNLTSYPGNYQTYLDKKAEDLKNEENANAEFDKKLSQEEQWIRQGIKARRTRNEGRVRALKALRQEHSQRNKLQGRAKATVSSSSSSGKIVFEALDLHYEIDNKTIVNNLELSVFRGDKLALIGPNGCGKSTLIRLLLGDLEPQSGYVKQGANLNVAYFDQHRLALDLDKSVIDVVGDGKRDLLVNGQYKHVMSYLQDYLFTPDRVNAPVRSLSGGEKNRLLLAKLLLKPSNILILDEPTNDLDVETLELLEDLISNYQGTVILVSHDREFVDNVVTSSLFFEGNGELKEFVGGYTDIENWYQAEKKPTEDETSVKSASPKSQPVIKKTKKLSYKHQLELDSLPQEIEKLENEVQLLQTKINDPEFFKQSQDDFNLAINKLAEYESSLEKAYARWDELEGM
ncbi:ABC transporter ATP-binding protein [Aliiglaciecola sp. 3_MG-2023]|uniref:ATP-binding cassette ATPase Uup n=1 Tax=Aliiglaciecola sp. 3_MG-2023 TaxID=3062644 RepID=UPI0026E49148|nr:ABC transporter ATP-binding protein [Aliiglaciecola sp. 3_MG-2023]MDO6692534.1 ABC transporter ATP-binding protein [Aliiglaciecola sp. 3_MG-2023]